ncbi:metal ABC transporter permease, putative [Babesia ovata]|uniref:Metal ABC transporter permease, putative n=1 Tax=Babesia ovata TaxID=189622 RepID=A0A2H6KJF9_9APIC|nr:metal ABC transporter permease, putative [Babesia ovata]GBE63135.1 metal ABC transporter permease, putative [Babesia ovata]
MLIFNSIVPRSTIIPIHVPPLQLLDEALQALGESVEHGVRRVSEGCGVECLDGRLEFLEHSGDLVVEVFLRGQVGEEGLEGGVDGGEFSKVGVRRNIFRFRLRNRLSLKIFVNEGEILLKMFTRLSEFF